MHIWHYSLEDTAHIASQDLYAIIVNEPKSKVLATGMTSVDKIYLFFLKISISVDLVYIYIFYI